LERRTFLQGSALSAGLLATGAPIASAASPLRVHVLAYDGAEELDFITPFDAFAKATFNGAAVRTTLVSTDRPGFVTTSTGVRMEIPVGWSPQNADLLVVPGGGPHDLLGSGLHRLINDKAFMRRLTQVKTVKVGVCTGLMALSAAGFTRGPRLAAGHRRRDDAGIRTPRHCLAGPVTHERGVTPGGEHVPGVTRGRL
jgi:putative intracellular protease/amidase